MKTNGGIRGHGKKWLGGNYKFQWWYLQYSVDRPTLSSDFALKLTWLLRVSPDGRGSLSNLRLSWQNHCHHPHEEFYFLSCTRIPPKPYHGEFHRSTRTGVFPAAPRLRRRLSRAVKSPPRFLSRKRDSIETATKNSVCACVCVCVCGAEEFQKLLSAQSQSLRATLATSLFPCLKINNSFLYLSQNTAKLTNPKGKWLYDFPFYFPMNSKVKMTP